jgi:hypothetical protein
MRFVIKFLKLIWNDPVWSKVIAGIILAVLTGWAIKHGTETASNSDKSYSPQRNNSTNSSPVLQTDKIKINLYKGTVGNWAAFFNLSFDYSNKTISGTYYYPKRPNVIYKLSGNFSNENIVLTEYTENQITATCKLTSNDFKCFSGVMNNTDGRKLDMNFCVSQ